MIIRSEGKSIETFLLSNKQLKLVNKISQSGLCQVNYQPQGLRWHTQRLGAHLLFFLSLHAPPAPISLHHLSTASGPILKHEGAQKILAPAKST